MIFQTLILLEFHHLQYCRRGKIHWAKHSWLQLYEVFHGNIFVVHWPPVFYYLPIAKNSQENFCGKLKNRKSLAQRIFPCLRYNIYITNIFILSIKHITEVVELTDWILDVHWLRNSDQSVGVLSTKMYLLISHTLAS